MGILAVTGRITAGEGVWKEVFTRDRRAGATYLPFTSVESMKDEKGVVHLRGVLFVIGTPKKDENICRLDPTHHPKSDHNLDEVRGLTSSSDPVWGTLLVVGKTGNDAGWIKWGHFEFSSTKMISLDGSKFQSDV